MKSPKDIFHVVSYLQYPPMLTAVYYCIKPYIHLNSFNDVLVHYNIALIFAGLGISLSTLQDTTKTQNNFSKRIWQDPKKGKIGLFVVGITAFSFILAGLYGLYAAQGEILQELSLGMTVLGIGQVGLLKVAIEMFENHRLNKKGEQESS